MKVKTEELIGPALDWAVAKCEGVINGDDLDTGFILERAYTPSTDWAQGGPIIEREELSFFKLSDDRGWAAGLSDGPTPLIAAMRAYVRFVMGEGDEEIGYEVEIPEDLIK